MMPDFEEGYLEEKNPRLYYRIYPAPYPDPQGTLVIAHGHGEHCARYEKFASQLKDKNLRIVCFDFRGHGRSEGRPVYVNRFEDFLDDMTRVSDFLKARHKIQKFYLLGHSNGGLVAVHWALRNPEKIQSLFLSSPFLGIRLPWFLILLNRLIHLFNPGYIYQNPVYPPYLTHNLAEVENYRKDKFIRRQITARLLVEMIRAIRELELTPVFEFRFPVYILMSGMEKVVDPSNTRLFYDKLRVPDKDLRVFEDMYHEIFNELGQEKVFAVLGQFLDRARSISF